MSRTRKLDVELDGQELEQIKEFATCKNSIINIGVRDGGWGVREVVDPPPNSGRYDIYSGRRQHICLINCATERIDGQHYITTMNVSTGSITLLLWTYRRAALHYYYERIDGQHYITTTNVSTGSITLLLRTDRRAALHYYYERMDGQHYITTTTNISTGSITLLLRTYRRPTLLLRTDRLAALHYYYYERIDGQHYITTTTYRRAALHYY